MIHPLSNAPEPKSRFIPSKWEAKRVSGEGGGGAREGGGGAWARRKLNWVSSTICCLKVVLLLCLRAKWRTESCLQPPYTPFLSVFVSVGVWGSVCLV